MLIIFFCVILTHTLAHIDTIHSHMHAPTHTPLHTYLYFHVTGVSRKVLLKTSFFFYAEVLFYTFFIDFLLASLFHLAFLLMF